MVKRNLDPWFHVEQAFAPNPYVRDPNRWLTERLGEFAWSKQRQVIDSVRDNRYTAVKSCHDAGKSWLGARVASWWLDTHPIGSAFVVSTAPTAPQVEVILWREIQKAHAKGNLPGVITGGTVPMWKSRVGGEILGYGRKPADTDPTAFQGIHARYVLVVIDEACGIPESLWNAVDALATNEAARVLAIGNPDDPQSHFAKICKPGSGWNTIRIDALETPAFTGEAVPPDLLEMLISPTWVEERKKRWGENSPLYIAKVRGEFPEVSDHGLIEAGWLRQCMENEHAPDRHDARFGLDVARFGADETIAYLREGTYVRLAYQARKQATTVTSGEIVQRVMDHPNRPPVAVDDTGVGGGVTDMLNEAGVTAMAMVGSGAVTQFWPNGTPRFKNARAEWYWHLRTLIREGALDLDPEDEDLQSQLLSLQYGVDSKGTIWIESKDDMKKRGLPSPDRADALMYACAPVEPLLVAAVSDGKIGHTLTGDLLHAGW